MNLQYSVYVLLGVFRFCFGEVADDSKNAQILKFDYDESGKGPYSFGFKSSDGIFREESGELHYAGTENEFMKVTGIFAYPGPDGVMYEVRYTADDQGFHPEGDHIKVPPFVPWIHHPHHGDSNEIADSGIGEQVLDVVRTTAKPSTEYLPSSTPTSTTLSPQEDNTVVGLISPPITKSTSKLQFDNSKSYVNEKPAPNPFLSGESILDAIRSAKIPGSRFVPKKIDNIESDFAPHPQLLSGAPVLDGVTSSKNLNSESFLNASPFLNNFLKPHAPNKVHNTNLKTLNTVGSANPATTGLDESIQESLSSTPKPHPELIFYSTAESRTQLRLVTPSPFTLKQMTKRKPATIK